MEIDKILLLHAYNLDALIETVKQKGTVLNGGFYPTANLLFLGKTVYYYSGNYFLIYTIEDTKSETGFSNKIESYPRKDLAQKQYEMLFKNNECYNLPAWNKVLKK